MAKGVESFNMDIGSNVLKQNENGRTITGLSLFAHKTWKTLQINMGLLYCSRKKEKVL
jgi:hypothetical protein